MWKKKKFGTKTKGGKGKDKDKKEEREKKEEKKRPKPGDERNRCGCKIRKVNSVVYLSLWGFLFCWMLEGVLVFASLGATNPSVVVWIAVAVDAFIYLAIFIYFVYINRPPPKERTRKRARTLSTQGQPLLEERSRAHSTGSDHRSKKKRKTKRPLPVVTAFLGTLLMGTVAGLSAGYLFQKSPSSKATVVSDVSPYDSPSASLSNVDVNFVENTFVQSKAGGLYIASDSHRYCVAPLLLKASRPATQSVSFFAVELDCCSGDNTFFSASCKSWTDAPTLSGRTLSGDANSNARQSALNAAQWHGFTVDKNALFFQLSTSKPSTLSTVNYTTIAWVVLVLAPIFWPLAWLFVLGLGAVLTCSKLRL